MSANDILILIDAEIAKLQQAHVLIAGAAKRASGRPKATAAMAAAKPKQKRKLYPEGRARIAAAVKARWASQKNAVK
jgi:hypothetical protein